MTTSLLQQLLSCTSDYLSAAAAATSPEPAITFLQQRPLPCSSSYQSWTSDHLPAPATTSPTTAAHSPAPVTTNPTTTSLASAIQSCASKHLPAAATTSHAQATTSLQQQLRVLDKQPPFCTSSYQSWTSDYLPAPAVTSPIAVTSSPTTTRLAPATSSCTSD